MFLRFSRASVLRVYLLRDRVIVSPCFWEEGSAAQHNLSNFSAAQLTIQVTTLMSLAQEQIFKHVTIIMLAIVALHSIFAINNIIVI